MLLKITAHIRPIDTIAGPFFMAGLAFTTYFVTRLSLVLPVFKQRVPEPETATLSSWMRQVIDLHHFQHLTPLLFIL
jgi:hypothetical protein